ncbi:pyrroline-5-carboxylate reductase [Paenibacillus nasutitermitis]|uniref:Pyrroline-5-carboxylate reductase n=1 Tax=Paenibacillus nasutitermitis TaxID=1652958 RepID=A0A916YXR4_9BACL|nr:pyrroline-5-carboxylate reductase [Paenibacillus nasutitermitis]GGD64853.1 pyrroline-5-carboxylate reductase [Paenibacillus nasutitermitis]
MSQLYSTSITPEISSLRLCFYGAGSMAEAIVRGLIDQGLTAPKQIGMINRQNAARLDELSARYGVLAAFDNESKSVMLGEADIVFLAIKPKDAAEALKQLRHVLRRDQLIVSIIAGLSIHTMESLLGQSMNIVRTMPNTSSTIGLGATGISFSSSVPEGQRSLAEAMFKSVGMTAVVEEHLLDVVTGVSGSGPAYIYYMMEAMIEAGRGRGLSDEAARELTIQTVLGAAHMVKSTNEHPADLRNKVTSPNGTTQAAIETLDAHGFSQAIIHAVGRAADRAAEMGKDIERSATS